MIDLHSASGDDLIRLVIAQHETIAQQERTIAELRGVIATLEATVAQLTQRVEELLAAVDAARDDAAGTGRPAGMPGRKPATGKARSPKRPRKRREQQFVRRGSRSIPKGLTLRYSRGRFCRRYRTCRSMR